jgi:hypothetical protein
VLLFLEKVLFMKYFIHSFVFVISLVASLSSSLYGAPNKGAGVLPFTLKDDGEFYCLLGREARQGGKTYSDFGGERDHESKVINRKKVFVLEPESKTALRKLIEETGYTSFAHITEHQIQKAPYYDAPTGYRLYLLPLDKASWRNAPTVQRNVNTAHQQKKPHVEKDIIAEVKVSDLLKAVNNPILKQGRPVAIIPKTNDQLFNLFKECLQQPAVQNIFKTKNNNFNQLVAQGKAIAKPALNKPTAKAVVPTKTAPRKAALIKRIFQQKQTAHRKQVTPRKQIVSPIKHIFQRKQTAPRRQVTPRKQIVALIKNMFQRKQPAPRRQATPRKHIVASIKNMFQRKQTAPRRQATPRKQIIQRNHGRRQGARRR